MTDDLRLLDDPLDAEVGVLLRGLDGGPALRVDADDVIARGARRRRLVVAERVLGVVATLVVIAGVAAFAFSRAGSAAPPPIAPSTPSPTDSGPLAIELNGGYVDLSQPSIGMTVLLLTNRSGGTLTIGGWTLVDPTGSTKAALGPRIAPGGSTDLELVDQRTLLSAPKRTSVLLAPGGHVNLVLAVTPSCRASDEQIRPEVVLDLRLADGTSSRQIIGQVSGGLASATNGAGWTRMSVTQICDTMPSPPASSVRPQDPSVTDGWWYSMGDAAAGTGLGVAGLKNEGAGPVTVYAPVVSGAAGVRAVLTSMIPAEPTATTVDIGYRSRLDKPAPASVVLLPGRSLFVVIGLPVTCTVADAAALSGATVTVALRTASGGTASYVLGSSRTAGDPWQDGVVRATCGSSATP